jgi:hypothetical protein
VPANLRTLKRPPPNNGKLSCYRMDDRGSRVRFPVWTGNFSLHRRVKTGSETHPASYPMGTRGFFPGVKRPGREADHSPPSSVEVKEWVELYLYSPNTPSWCGPQLKSAQGQLYLYLYVSHKLYKQCKQWKKKVYSYLLLNSVSKNEMICYHNRICYSQP